MSDDLTRPLRASALPSQVAEDLLRLADDEFIIGHRHSEWLGLAPFLEEDLTMASIAQDELGHARALYHLLWPDWDDREAGVVRRGRSDWRSCSLVERRSPTWEFALMRHALYDTAEPLRWMQLRSDHASVITELEALVANVLTEEQFHQRHATDLVVRLGTANEAARAKLQSALDELWPDAQAMAADGNDAPGMWAGPFREATAVICAHADLVLPDNGWTPPHCGERTTRHPDFDGITESLLAVFAFDPDATW
jgi:ring-1,2-phenylacetyl-CoA epoxidase subunit PaaC